MDQGKLKLIFVALALFLFVTPSSFAAGTESGAKAVLAAMEQKLFFKVYGDDTLDNRLARIEKRVYGEAGAGDFAERLERVRAVAAPQVNPDGTVSGEVQQTQQAPAEPQVSPEEAARAEKEAAAQRAKVAAMAAKEEEESKLLAEGVELFRQKKATPALEKFQQVVSFDPHNAEALFNMGVAYESLNKLGEASTSYQKASQENPNNPDYQEAVAAVDKKLKAHGKGADKGPLSILAEDAALAFKRGEYFSAIDLYKQLDEKAPNQHLVKYNLGTLYFATKNYSVALEYYQDALRLKPGEPRYQKAVEQLSASLGQTHQKQRELDAAWDKHEADQAAYNQRVAQRGQQPGAQPMQQPQQYPQPPQQQYQQAPQQQYQQPPQQQYQQPQQQQPQAQNPPAKQKKQKPPKVAAAPPQQPSAMNNVLTPQGAADAMASIGINAKPSHDGLVITTIGMASRALKVGLQQGDIIKAVDGLAVKSKGEMNQILSRKAAGAPVQLIIQRAKQVGTFTL